MIRRTAALAALVLALGACTGADDGSDATPEPADTAEAPATDQDGMTADDMMADPDGPDPVRVLVAATVLTTGDVEAALAEGLLTTEEVEAASRGIEDGTLQEWIDRAERILDGG